MIRLKNFNTTTFTINFPLLYLHGSVENSGQHVACRNQTLQSEIEWPVAESEFKSFTFLKQGENDIILRSLEEELHLHVTYIQEEHIRFVLPVYIICESSDGTFLAPDDMNNSVEEAIMKLKLNTRLMQTFIAESLHENGFDRHTFYLPEDKEGQPIVKMFHSKLKLEDTNNMTPDDLYAYFNEEITSSLSDNPFCKYLCFMSCTRYFPPADYAIFDVKHIMSYVRGHAALGGGNMALFGTGSIHTWASHLAELHEKFTDNTLVNRCKDFDDSCGRNTYWSNYSTTLGAAIHELGHCFDLPHTPHGIMSRGHDDMNVFYTVSEPSSDGEHKVCLKNVGLNNQGKYKGAHWHRSSAVILRYHKWLNPSHSSEKPHRLSISLHPNLLGPVGNNGSCCQSNQKSFNSKKWLDDQNMKLTGVVFYHGEYLCGVQFLGGKYDLLQDGGWSCEGAEVSSPIYGSPPPSAIKTIFRLDYPNEKIKSIKIRGGAWIDGIQIMTNFKSSTWLGGCGGDEHIFTLALDENVKSLIGTAGEYVGSLAISTDKNVAHSVNLSAVTFTSNRGVRLFQIVNEDEVTYFEEYTDDPPPQSLCIELKKFFNDKTDRVRGTIFDDSGEKLDISLSRLELELLNEI